MPNLEIDAHAAELCASLNGLAQRMDRESQWRERVARAVQVVPFAGSITISGGTGLYDVADQLQAKTGFIWSIRRLTAYGFTAGTVTAYKNSALGEPLCPYPVAAVNTFGKGEQKLLSNDRIVWGASGVTAASGAVTFWGEADCFESWYLPFYLA